MASLVRLGRVLRAGSGLFGAVVRKQPGLRHAAGAHEAPVYRQLATVNKSLIVKSEILAGFMWFWIMWHFWHKPEDIFGHFPYPDPSEWTDEELGILPEDD